MADAENILDARGVSEMPKPDTAIMKGKGIKGGENLDWGPVKYILNLEGFRLLEISAWICVWRM